MASSPAKRHLQRVLAEHAAVAAAGSSLMAGTTIYQQMQLQLANDRARLKQIQSGEGKAKLKAVLLPEYSDYVDGVLAADQGGPDDVVATVMLWNIDAGDFDRGLDIAAYVLAHRIPMPDQFSRTTGCLVAEEVAVAALNAQKTGGEFDQGVLDRAVALTEGHDMPDQVRAKLLLARARGLLQTDSEQLPLTAEAVDLAVTDLVRAIQLHDSCGGKKDLEGAQRLQKKFAGNQSND